MEQSNLLWQRRMVLVDMLVVQRSSKYQKEVDLCEKVVNEQYLECDTELRLYRRGG